MVGRLYPRSRLPSRVNTTTRDRPAASRTSPPGAPPVGPLGGLRFGPGMLGVPPLGPPLSALVPGLLELDEDVVSVMSSVNRNQPVRPSPPRTNNRPSPPLRSTTIADPPLRF